MAAARFACPALAPEVGQRGALQCSPLGSRPSTAERSAALCSDPKMREIQHFLGSRGHQERLIAAADLRSHERGGQPSEMVLATRILREAEANEDHDPTYLRGMDHLAPRIQWREGMDRNLRRLVTDTELAIASSVPKPDEHRLRCNHLDKTFDWYERHGIKEARKEKAPPAFIRFDTHGPAMPGSLRTCPRIAPVLLGTTGFTTATSSFKDQPRLSHGLRASSPALLQSPQEEEEQKQQEEQEEQVAGIDHPEEDIRNEEAPVVPAVELSMSRRWNSSPRTSDEAGLTAAEAQNLRLLPLEPRASPKKGLLIDIRAAARSVVRTQRWSSNLHAPLPAPSRTNLGSSASSGRLANPPVTLPPPSPSLWHAQQRGANNNDNNDNNNNNNSRGLTLNTRRRGLPHTGHAS
ncbi:unnamed protein product [Polarella glacialis]|uniref:Uncharacterized protein n=1 Tax=Polarella glacialis TaxID=89957 RepID=A0A813LM83_POLGL|nr:unnamed protein product [Polarella glacialis]